MVNNGEGVRVEHTSKRKAKDPMERSNRNALQMLLLTGLNDNTTAIRMNLLTKSGLKGNNVERDPEHSAGLRAGGRPPSTGGRPTVHSGQPLSNG